MYSGISYVSSTVCHLSFFFSFSQICCCPIDANTHQTTSGSKWPLFSIYLKANTLVIVSFFLYITGNNFRRHEVHHTFRFCCVDCCSLWFNLPPFLFVQWPFFFKDFSPLSHCLSASDLMIDRWINVSISIFIIQSDQSVWCKLLIESNCPKQLWNSLKI